MTIDDLPREKKMAATIINMATKRAALGWDFPFMISGILFSGNVSFFTIFPTGKVYHGG